MFPPAAVSEESSVLDCWGWPVVAAQEEAAAQGEDNDLAEEDVGWWFWWDDSDDDDDYDGDDDAQEGEREEEGEEDSFGVPVGPPAEVEGMTTGSDVEEEDPLRRAEEDFVWL